MRSVSRRLKRRSAAMTACSSFKRRDFGAQFVDEHSPRDRLPFGHPQQVVALGVGDQQIAQVLAGREDLQQNRQRFAIALEQRAPATADCACRRDEAIQIVERHVGIAQPRQMLGQLIADVGQQIERDARSGHPHQVGVRPLEIVQAPSPQPACRLRADDRDSGEVVRCPSGRVSRCLRAYLCSHLGCKPCVVGGALVYSVS